MQYLAAAGLAAVVAVVILWKTGKHLPGRVIYNKPTTVWPIGTVVSASLAALTIAAFTAASDMEPGPIIALSALTWFVVGYIGRSVNGTRLVYDRGGRQFEPASVVAAIVAFFAIFFWLLQAGT